jgi:hypothetical protein
MTNKESDSKEFALQQEKLLVNRIIKSLKTEECYGLLGDSDLDLNLWEEICIQEQYEKSSMWEHYESIVLSHIHSALKQLPRNVYDALEEYYSDELLLAEDDQNPDATSSETDIANYILQELILPDASMEINESLIAYKKNYWDKRD